MKKKLFLPVAALLILGACSSEDEVVRPVPNDPIQTVPSVADHVSLNAPAQSDVKVEGSFYRISYANGQEILYSFAIDNTEGDIAIVRKIEGTASDVVIPASVTYNDVELIVYCVNLYPDGIKDNVTSLTLPNTAVAMPEGTSYKAVNAEYLRNQFAEGKKLQKIELEDGFSGFCTINGAVYSSDFTTLVSVPREYPGTFTVAESTTVIDDRALFYCSKIDVLTIPSGVTKIGNEAVNFNNNLLLINCLPVKAPEASADAFGTYAHNGVLRIPAGAEDNYKFSKPEIQRPKEPVEPDEELATPEEMEAYEEALAVYETEVEEYKAAMETWANYAGWAYFKNIEGVNF